MKVVEKKTNIEMTQEEFDTITHFMRLLLEFNEESFDLDNEGRAYDFVDSIAYNRCRDFTLVVEG